MMPHDTIGLETSRLDTLLAYLAIVTDFANYEKYGISTAKVYPYIRSAKDVKSLQRYKWHAYIYVKPETYFRILLGKWNINAAIDNYSKNIKTLSALTAGLIDSDGAIIISVKSRRGKYYFEPEVEIVNANKELLEKLQKAWLIHGIELKVHKHSKEGITGKATFRRLKPVWRLRATSHHTIHKLLNNILPYMTHIKRIARAAIVKAYIEGKIQRNPQQIKKAHQQLKEYYENMLKTISINLIKKLHQIDKILSIQQDGTIKIIKRPEKPSRKT